MSDVIRENRLRRVAHRRGLKLVKSRTRDKGALDFGLFGLVRKGTGIWINDPLDPLNREFPCSWTIDRVEAYLTGD